MAVVKMQNIHSFIQIQIGFKRLSKFIKGGVKHFEKPLQLLKCSKDISLTDIWRSKLYCSYLHCQNDRMPKCQNARMPE